MDDPLVSIIIPVYNAGRYLSESMESAIAQTWHNKEIIIIDDGSIDNSLEIARSFQRDGIYVLTQPNKGASAARNLGLQHAKGRYVQFLDADDVLSPNKIEKQVLDLKGSDELLSVCSTIHFPNDKKAIKYLPDNYEERFLHDIPGPVEFLIRIWGGYDNLGSMIQPNAWLVPMSIIRKAGYWDEKLTLDDDGEFFCRVILNSKGIIKTEGCFNYYRKHHHHTNLSGSKDIRGLNSLLDSVLSKKKELLSRCNSKEAQQAIDRQLYDVFILSYPTHPEIYKIVEKELTGNTIRYKQSLGGTMLNLIVKIFGLKPALYLRSLLKNKT